MRCVLQTVERYAAKDVVLLIEGETGTGKSLLARHVHQCSRRAARPFVALSVAALEDALAGSELFGHVPGAFTGANSTRHGAFQSASGGTLFLDEIGRASVAVQRRLLVAIEELRIKPVGADRDFPVDVRVIAASNVPLRTLVAREEFFEDLYARLETFRIELPPLAERREDIPPLVRHFVEKHAERLGDAGVAPTVDPALMDAMCAAEWRRNVRELEGAVRRLLVDADGAPVLRLEHCTGDLAYLRQAVGGARSRVRARVSREPLRLENEKKIAAARRLGVSRPTLDRYLAEEARRTEAGTGTAPTAEAPPASRDVSDTPPAHSRSQRRKKGGDDVKHA